MSAFTHSGQVYFIACGSYVKIGYTSQHIAHRLYALRNSGNLRMPEGMDRKQPMRVLRLIPGCIMRDEHRVHALFEKHNAVGEWYHLTPALLHQIQRLDFVTDREVLSEFRRCRRDLKQAKLRRAAA